MNKKSILTIAVLLCTCIMLSSCDDEEEGGNKVLISSYNSDDSHKNGQDCMECHYLGGNGEGWFITAGSVYDSSKENPYPNATVKLYTGPSGTGSLVGTIEVDKRGNFYTTENIDFLNGIYTTVTGSDGKIKTMEAKITSGACNSCHGTNTDYIWVE